MPRYFFNTVDGRRFPDEEGADLPDLVAVRAEATRVVGELLKEQPEDLWAHGRLRLEVTDESGGEVLVVKVSIEPQIAA
jgi:hypothetical protein